MNHAPTSSNTGIDTSKLALLITLASETFFFGTLISAYMVFRSSVTDWPATQINLSRLAVPLANTLLLVLSAVVASAGLHSIRRGDRSGLRRWFTLALVMGLVFVGGQIFEYLRTGMVPKQAAGGVFLTLMGFHALHMLAGVVVLGLVLARTRLNDFTAQRHTAVIIATWFWYYVVAVWFFLFSVLYLV